MRVLSGWVVILLVLAATAANAQTATATSGATIQPGLTLLKTADLVFGSIIPNTGGTVVISTPLSPATPTRTPGGSVTFASGTWSAATFTVGKTGVGNSHFSVTLPASVTITNTSDNTKTMTISPLTHNARTSNPYDSPPFTLYVGGTLTIANGQAAGTYRGTFDVTLVQR